MPEGKIIKALSGFYYVADNDQIIQCRGRGVFRKQKITPLVGDTVIYQAENPTDGYIMEIKERRNELVRPPIANVDQAILVFSAAEPDFSTSLLDRFLVLVESKDINPIICISKMDLLRSEDNKSIEEYAEQYVNATAEQFGDASIVISDATVKALGGEKFLTYTMYIDGRVDFVGVMKYGDQAVVLDIYITNETQLQSVLNDIHPMLEAPAFDYDFDLDGDTFA